MVKISKKAVSTVLALSIVLGIATHSGDNFNILAEQRGVEDYTVSNSDVFISMDENGNPKFTPINEVETIDINQLEKIDNKSYEVHVEVDGEKKVMAKTDTLEEAKETVGTIHAVLEDNPEALSDSKENDNIESNVGNAEENAGENTDESATAQVLDNGIDIEKIIKENFDSSEVVSEDDNAKVVETYIIDVVTLSEQNASSVNSVNDDSIAVRNVTTQIVETEKATSYGVVVFKNQSAYVNTEYTDFETGASGYMNATYAPDAAYLGMYKGKVKFMQAGVIGLVSPDKVSIIEYDDFVDEGKITSRYKTTSGKLYHEITTNLKHISTTQLCGYTPSFMKDNKTYYSYDGHYFYTSYVEMLKDYNTGTYKNSINPNEPYYNYYMFLSHRTKTDFTAEDLNSYINSKIGSNSSSKLLNTGKYFIQNQKEFTVNAALMLGVAINESAFGTSSIAKNKNNLFGHGAVDSNPYYGSNGYSSPQESIKYHAEYFVSIGYLDVATDSRYFGPHLGNKESGMNVKYASDPYWGEKAAAWAWHLEDYTDKKISQSENSIVAIVNGNVPAYKEADTSSKILYHAKNKNYSVTNNIPVVVLEKITVDGVDWYKVASDIALTSNRNGVNCNEVYNPIEDYVYMKASSVNIISGTLSEPDESKPETSEPDESKPETSKPDESKPETSKPDESKPETSEPDESKPETSKPDESKPETSEPDESKPETSEPDESKPETSKPDESKPETSEPDESKPETSKPDESKPETSEPDESKPETSEPDESKPETSEPDESKPETSEPEPTYMTGDVDEDGRITAVDYMLIKNHIMEVSELKGQRLIIADVDKDGRITAVDYMLIKNHIMGVISLT